MESRNGGGNGRREIYRGIGKKTNHWRTGKKRTRGVSVKGGSDGGWES